MDDETFIAFKLEENRLLANLAFSKRCLEACETPLMQEQWQRFAAMDEHALQSHRLTRTTQTELTRNE